ncbi:MAG: LysM peptidoglycan-binding domain-containing protein [Pseudomonadota bacterium]
MVTARRFTGPLLLILALLLSACATGFDTQQYTVKSGDSLYFIAWKYKVDAEQLARWNNLSEPYQIYPGDQIVIHPNGYSAQTGGRAQKQSGTYIVQRGDTLYSIGREVGMSPDRIARLNSISRPYTIYPDQRLRLQGDVPASNTRQPDAGEVARSTGSRKKQPPPVNVPAGSPSAWKWPIEGSVVNRFAGRDSTRQGIDIAGKEGDTIRAAAGGVVVYSGGGLINYGQLVIVKHSDAYLSAYGYNRKLLVKEGERVKPGQAIAEMGGMAQDQPMLHFEIRKYGKPVDPMHYLPGRT